MTSRPGPRSWRRIAVLLLGLIASLSLPAGAWAQETDDDGPAVSLRLSPAEVTIPHQPGTTDHTIRVDNLGSRPVSVVAMVEEFTVTADGTTHFTGPEEIASSGWVRLDTDGFDLAPGERRDVQLTVEVPEDAEPGERYLGVVFAVPAADGEGNIRVTHRVATKLYVELPGPRIERLELGELTGPTLIDSRPARFELTVHNEGNVHRRFEEDDQLVATSGDASFPFQNFTILTGSTRIVETV